MSFKTRLILSYVVMFVAPIILTIIAAAVMVVINVRAVAGSYGFEFKGNPVKQVMEKNQEAFDNIKVVASENPDVLRDKMYLENLEKELNKLNTSAVVRINNNIIYSSNNLKRLDLNEVLPEFGSATSGSYERALLGNEVTFMRHQDFYFTDKSQGTVFFITDMTPILKRVGRVVLYMCVVILLILIATDGILTYYVSKGVLRPIETLKNAANQIEEGNLEFEVKPASEDEIGELCTAFEKMRVKLKESINLQMQYENNRKELISNISHDLKTPVTAIKGYVEGILDGVADTPEKTERYIRTIYAKASDLDKLIDELFLFSKLDLNNLTFNFEQVDIKEYLEDCVQELSLGLEKDNISLNLNTEKITNPFVLVDNEKLKRVIINIVENASKYMDKEEGKIDIRLEENDDKVIIEIKDNGQGIPKEDIPCIFDRFYRTDKSRSSLTGGSGLGLAIVKRIIEEHEGKVWAESEEGKGTSIFFTLKTIKK
ncbi:sensor histidine kinase [Clostridium omnivorum]|uniref:histidine kinase n=1 Tax=Clostridium omnivorum TaxID=1604902 RepID=A0ABQ5N4Z2_9CLOT|nr:HAMP domain-containing sensor histidine kinase [Clostridium sp. E14]GLC30308.1 two-component sensor histidine kinase [Clostridium sp. E14]